MKLRQIDVENFGIFTERQFVFGDAPFQLIYGPNEAGKSTLLQLLRQVLFDFPVRSPYQFETHSGKMAAQAVIDLADSRQITFLRQKGKKDKVKGEIVGTGESINEAALKLFLGNASAKLYEHVFGFSLNELASGEESLKHANLNEALFGGSLGSPSNLQAIQKSLETETGQLFKAGAKNPTINALLRDIGGREKLLKEAALKPREFEDKEKALREAEEQVAALGEDRDQAERQRAHLQRLSQAIEPWVDRQAIHDELEQIEVPEGVTAASGAALQRLLDDLRRAESGLNEAALEVAQTDRQLGGLQLAPEFTQAEPQIRSLEKEVSRVQRDAELVPQLQSESRAILADVEKRLAELNPAWDLTYLDAFQSSLEQREKLNELATNWSQLEKLQGKVTARQPDLMQRVAIGRSRLAELDDVKPVPEIDGILERESSYRAAVSSLEEAADTQASLVSQTNALRKRLTSALLNPEMSDDELAELPVPLESLLRSFQDRHAVADAACEKADVALQQVSESLKSKQAELAARVAEGQVPDRSQLEDQRERRDSGWKLIRRKFLPESGVEGDDADIDGQINDWTDDAIEALPDIYEREVAETDRIADDRQAKAKDAAIRDQLHVTITQLEASISEATAARDEVLQRRDELTREWHELLAEFQVKTHSPDVILEWQRVHENWLESRSTLSDSQKRTDRLKEQATEFESLLALNSSAVASDSATESTVDQQLAAVRRCSEELKAAAQERRQIEKSLPVDEEALAKLETEISQLDERQAEWKLQWAALLGEFGFPPDWPVSTVSKMLQGLNDARQKYQESKSLDQRASVLSDEIGVFQHEARAVSQAVCPELIDFPLTDMVTRLSERLSQALQAGQDQTSLLRDKQKIEQQISARQRERDEFSARIASMLTDVGISTTDQFLEVAQKAERQQKLISEETALTRDLKRTVGTEEFGDFLNELAETDTDTLQLRLAEAQRQYQEIDTRRDEAVRLETAARNSLESLDGTSRAAALQLEQESSYAQLGTAVDHLVPLALAQTLLNRAVERFEKEHQPAMLSEVGSLLSKMTGERYVGIRRRLDEAGTMQVEQHDGKLKTPDQLSTGTREQLYLAIRLAYVQQYCRDSEPLPLIMDDILVNFDEQRARNTLEVLFGLPDGIQVLFLTCHEHMSELVRELRPGSVPIELSNS